MHLKNGKELFTQTETNNYCPDNKIVHYCPRRSHIVHYCRGQRDSKIPYLMESSMARKVQYWQGVNRGTKGLKSAGRRRHAGYSSGVPDQTRLQAILREEGLIQALKILRKSVTPFVKRIRTSSTTIKEYCQHSGIRQQWHIIHRLVEGALLWQGAPPKVLHHRYQY